MLQEAGRVSGSSLRSLPGEGMLEDYGRACGTETSDFKFSINVDLITLFLQDKGYVSPFPCGYPFFFLTPFLYHVFLLSLSKVVSSVFLWASC